MNLDLRSQLQNTEIALLIRSARTVAQSRRARSRPRCARAPGTWSCDDGALVWRAPPGSDLQDARTEPDASASLRLLLKLLGPLAPDEML